ncbi:MAG: acyl-CoA thioesterase [Oligoflexia bacterium]
MKQTTQTLDAPWHHQCRIFVRGYELDSYRHVNHAVYLNYLEHARWEFLASCGLTLSRLDELKRWPVVRHLQIDYLKSALINEELVILSRLSELGRASLVIEQEIRRGEQLITRAQIKAAIIDEKGRAVAVPREFSELSKGES